MHLEPPVSCHKADPTTAADTEAQHWDTKQWKWHKCTNYYISCSLHVFTWQCIGYTVVQ